MIVLSVPIMLLIANIGARNGEDISLQNDAEPRIVGAALFL